MTEEAAVLNRVLVVLAHPDDPEFFCGATIAKWTREGKQVRYCLLTCGTKGSDDPSMTTEQLCAIRHEEQANAARELGVTDLVWLDFVDGEVVPSLEARVKVAREIRRFKPDIVVTSDPLVLYSRFGWINHPDHRAAGQITLDAIFPGAGNRMYYPELLAEGLEPHEIKQIFIAVPAEPNCVVDVSDTFDLKIKALRRHVSQVKDPDGLEKRLRERMSLEDGSLVERFRLLSRI